MDDVIEFLGELIFEGAQELIDSKHTPLPLKILAFIILTIVYVGLALLCIWGIATCPEIIVKVLLGVVAAMCLFLAGKMYWKLLTRKRR